MHRCATCSTTVARATFQVALYAAHFEKLGLTRREFHGLLQAGAQWRSWSPDENGVESLELTHEGEPVTELMLITAGSVEVLRNGASVSTLGAGALVGEGTFARREYHKIEVAPERARRWTLASATVVAHGGPIEFVAWPTQRLARHMATSTRVKACLMTIVASAQAARAAASRAAPLLSVHTCFPCRLGRARASKRG